MDIDWVEWVNMPNTSYKRGGMTNVYSTSVNHLIVMRLR